MAAAARVVAVDETPTLEGLTRKVLGLQREFDHLIESVTVSDPAVRYEEKQWQWMPGPWAQNRVTAQTSMSGQRCMWNSHAETRQGRGGELGKEEQVHVRWVEVGERGRKLKPHNTGSSIAEINYKSWRREEAQITDEFLDCVRRSFEVSADDAPQPSPAKRMKLSLAGMRDDVYILRSTLAHDIDVQTLQDISKNFTLSGVSGKPVVEFARGDGSPPLRAHAHVIAKLGGVLGTHCDATSGFGGSETDAPHPIDTSKPPYSHCAADTLKVLIGFSYLGESENVTQALAGLPGREQWALRDLVEFLSGSSAVDPVIATPPSSPGAVATVDGCGKLEKLQRMCRDAIKASAGKC